MSWRRKVTVACHCDCAVSRWLNQAATAEVRPPIAAPPKAEIPEMIDASIAHVMMLKDPMRSLPGCRPGCNRHQAAYPAHVVPPKGRAALYSACGGARLVN